MPKKFTVDDIILRNPDVQDKIEENRKEAAAKNRSPAPADTIRLKGDIFDARQDRKTAIQQRDLARSDSTAAAKNADVIRSIYPGGSVSADYQDRSAKIRGEIARAEDADVSRISSKIGAMQDTLTKTRKGTLPAKGK